MGASIKDWIGLISAINNTWSTFNQNKLNEQKFNSFGERLETANFYKQKALENQTLA